MFRTLLARTTNSLIPKQSLTCTPTRAMSATSILNNNALPSGNEHQVLTLPSSRQVGYATYGPQSGTPIFVLHALPGSRLDARYFDRHLSATNVRLIGLDRPGIGLSTPDTTRTVLDYPKEVLAVADHLKLDNFRVMALGAASPYALACTLAIPKERLRATGLVYGLGPIKETGIHNIGLCKTQFLFWWVATNLPDIGKAMLNSVLGNQAQGNNPADFEKYLKDSISYIEEPASRKVFDDEANLKALVDSLRECFKNGVDATTFDAKLVGGDWGFEMEDIRQKGHGGLAMWYGEKDEHSPLSMARYMLRGLGGKEVQGPYAEAKKQAEEDKHDVTLRVYKDEDQITLMDHWGNDILEEFSRRG